jgi:DinB superfamily
MDTPQILGTLADTPRWLRAGLSQLTEAEALRPPRPGEWCLADIVAHLRASDAILAPRVYHVLVRDQPPLIGFDERAWALIAATAQTPLMSQLDAFAGLRAELLGVLRALDASAWSRYGIHETRGRLTLRETATDLATHELEHRTQWDAVLVALGASGAADPS